MTAAVVLCLVSILFTIIDGGAAETDTLATVVGRLATQKSEAEQLAKRVKANHRPAEAIYGLLETYYGNAKAKHDGVVAALRVALIQDRDPAKDPNLQAVLRDALTLGRGFIEFAKAAAQPKPAINPKSIGEVVAQAITATLKSVGDLWKLYRDGKKEQRYVILAEVDRLRWPDFTAITAK